jgi:endonuclease/exonuclease/phosphatase family metal-dependent hydrolase
MREASMSKLMTILTLSLCFTITLGACGDDVLGPGEQEALLGVERAGQPDARVMNWNLYVGAEIEGIAAAGSLEELVVLAGQTWAAVQATDFRERAETIADYIAEYRPHAVALQEVSTFTLRQPSIYTGYPGDWVEHTDFLEILLEALRTRGIRYTDASVVHNFAFEVPALLGSNPATDLVDIRLQDADIVLVRDDVIWHSPAASNYSENPTIYIGGQPLEITRGFASVVIELKGKEYRVVSTHLTPREEGETEQLAQADELIALLHGVTEPVFVMGDLNTAPGNTWTDSYGKFTDAGYTDLWTLGAPGDPGPTCCQENDLLNTTSILDRRFDLVFYRDPAPLDGIGLADQVMAERLGATPSEKTTSNLWPSDHAGVVVNARPLPGIGNGH